MSELKKCPFCPEGKGEVYADREYHPHELLPEYLIRCDDDCDARTDLYKTQEAAIKAWNTSPIEQELQNRVEILRTDREKFCKENISLRQNIESQTQTFDALMKKYKVLAKENAQLKKQMEWQDISILPLLVGEYLIQVWEGDGIKDELDITIAFYDGSEFLWCKGGNTIEFKPEDDEGLRDSHRFVVKWQPITPPKEQ